MRKRNFTMAAVMLVVLGSFAPPARPQAVLTLSGKIVSTTRAARYTVKLYPPLSSGKRVLLTTSTASGEFKFMAPAASYLLEVFSGKSLVYQEVIKLDKSRTITVDLRKPTAN